MRVLFFFMALISPLHAKTTRFEVRDAVGRDVVQFVSQAPLDKTVGLTSSIAGWVELDPERLSTALKGEFEVDIRAFDTGMELRNEHFWGKYMTTAEFPTASFVFQRGESSDQKVLLNQEPVRVNVQGDLKIRGKVKAISIPLKLTYFKESEFTKQRLGGNLLKISADFSIDVTRFGIEFPDALKLVLSKTVNLSVDVVGTDALPQAVIPSPPHKPTR